MLRSVGGRGDRAGNALHEVFSACYSADLGEVDVPLAKSRVLQALGGAVNCLAPGGWLVLFDGLDHQPEARPGFPADHRRRLRDDPDGEE